LWASRRSEVNPPATARSVLIEHDADVVAEVLEELELRLVVFRDVSLALCDDAFELDESAGKPSPCDGVEAWHYAAAAVGCKQ
jgi:hypothetical protein